MATPVQKLIDQALAELKLTRYGWPKSGKPTGHMAEVVTLLARARAAADPPKPTYVNPFKDAKGLIPLRTDQGVDFMADPGSPILAIGKAKVTRATTSSGWPLGGCVQYVLLDGDHVGNEIYVAEAITPKVKTGQMIAAGATVAVFRLDKPTNRRDIETGYAKPGTHEPCDSDTSGKQTPGGKAMARFLRHLGCPTQQNPGPGSDKSPCA